MQEFSDKREWSLRSVVCESEGTWYAGKGVLEWNPDRGFHLEAFVEPTGEPKPGFHSLSGMWRTGVIPRDYYSSIRMKGYQQEQIVAPDVPLIEPYVLRSEGRLSIDLQRVLFVRRYAHIDIGWPVLACAKFEPTVQLPDVVETRCRVADEEFDYSSYRHDALRWSDGTKHLYVRLLSDDTISVNFSLEGPCRVAKAAQRTNVIAVLDALSILSGRRFSLVEVHFMRPTTEIVEVRAPTKKTVLGGLSPIHTPGQSVNKERLIALAECLVNEPQKAKVIRGIFFQLGACRTINSTRHCDKSLGTTVAEMADPG